MLIWQVAVYGWNLAIALATGNSTIWKPSPTTPLCSVAVTRIIQPVLERNGLPGAVAALVTGDVEVGKEIVGSPDIDMGRWGSTCYILCVGDVFLTLCSQFHWKRENRTTGRQGRAG